MSPTPSLFSTSSAACSIALCFIRISPNLDTMPIGILVPCQIALRYLPQYEKPFTVGKAAGAMCSYAAANGIPSCTNNWLLNEVLRRRWGREDAYITTDCGAVQNTMGPPLNLPTQEQAAAATINGGTDLEQGPVPSYLACLPVNYYFRLYHWNFMLLFFFDESID